jgi:hypothetical protein
MTRLRLPMKFRTAELAGRFISAASLYPCGAKPVQVGDLWFVVIVPRNVDMSLRHLSESKPALSWVVEDDAPTEQRA